MPELRTSERLAMGVAAEQPTMQPTRPQLLTLQTVRCLFSPIEFSSIRFNRQAMLQIGPFLLVPVAPQASIFAAGLLKAFTL